MHHQQPQQQPQQQAPWQRPPQQAHYATEQASLRQEQQQQLQQQQPQQQQQALLHPMQAQCLASEAALRRSGTRLLAQVAGSADLLIAATGSCCLLLSATAEAIRPLASLHEGGGDAGITAVAVSSVGGRPRQWAAVLEGGAATFLLVDSSGTDSACYGGGPEACAASVRLAEGMPGLEALAWHPSQPVCALLAPHELLLVAPDGPPEIGAGGVDSGGGGGASSCSEDGDEDGSAAKLQTWGTWRSGTVGGSSLRGDWGSLSGVAGGSGAVLLALPAPTGSGGRGATGRCCLAWLGVGASGGEPPTEAQRQLVVSWGGGHLELLSFGAGWHLQERRQLLPGLPGPVCGLAAGAPDCLLAATERPVSHWLDAGGGAAGGDADAALQPGVLQRGLSAQQAPPPPVLLPRHSWPPGAAGDATQAAQAALPPVAGSAESSPDGGGGGIIELSAHWRGVGADPSNPFLSPPTAPPGPPIPAMFLLQQPRASSGPLAAGLPRLPGTPPGVAQPGPMTPLQRHLGEGGTAAVAAGSAGGVGVPAAEGGHAALLWFGSGSPAGSPGGNAGPSPAGSPREQLGVRLGVAADLLQVLGSVAVLASSKAPPVLSLCRLGRSGLQQAAAIPLAPPAGVPDGCTLRLRGLAVQPAAGGDAAIDAWVLLAAAQPGAAAPFLSAALSSQLYGSAKQQLWLCCYRLPPAALPAPAAPPSSAAASVAATVPAAAAAPAALAAPPATAAPSEVDAVRSLQHAVADLRAAMNARLDELDERLAALLAARRPPSAR